MRSHNFEIYKKNVFSPLSIDSAQQLLLIDPDVYPSYGLKICGIVEKKFTCYFAVSCLKLAFAALSNESMSEHSRMSSGDVKPR